MEHRINQHLLSSLLYTQEHCTISCFHTNQYDHCKIIKYCNTDTKVTHHKPNISFSVLSSCLCFLDHQGQSKLQGGRSWSLEVVLGTESLISRHLQPMYSSCSVFLPNLGENGATKPHMNRLDL